MTEKKRENEFVAHFPAFYCKYTLEIFEIQIGVRSHLHFCRLRSVQIFPMFVERDFIVVRF